MSATSLNLPLPSITARLNLGSDPDPLPPFPDGVPAPEVSLELHTELRTVITINGFPVRFWETPVDEFDDFADQRKRKASWASFMTEDQIEAVREWGAALHKRLDIFAYQIFMAALTPETTSRLVEFAMRDFEQVSTDSNRNEP